MKQAVPYLGRFLSKLIFEIIPGALVSMLAAYFLSMLHLAQGAEPALEAPSVAAIQNDGLSADERREMTRQMLKERRENPEEPAEVKPVPSLRPSTPHAETADLTPVTANPVAGPHAPQVAAPEFKVENKTEAKARAEPELKLRSEPRSGVVALAPATPLPRPAAPRVKSEPAVAALTPAPVAPAPAVTGSLPPASTTVTALPQVSVTAPPPPSADISTEPPRRGIVGNVFSGISTIAGGAANLTGNTVNWVIDLPGKAISAGGKLIGAGSSASSAPPAAPAAAPAAVPAPTAAPTVDPQRRNLL